jgi:micrococcal nuclease
VGLLLLALLIWLDRSPVRRGWQRQPQGGEKLKAYDFEKYHGKTFTVVKVVDGDTIDVDVADGKYNHTRIRLWGIDTPETKSDKFDVMYFGPEATEFTKELALGKQVTVYLDKGNRTRGKHGRLLAYVQLSDKRFLNEVLVAEGYAYTDLRFAHSFYHKYEQLQASARRQKKGLWPNVKRDQLPEWLQRMRPILLQKK